MSLQPANPGISVVNVDEDPGTPERGAGTPHHRMRKSVSFHESTQELDVKSSPQAQVYYSNISDHVWHSSESMTGYANHGAETDEDRGVANQSRLRTSGTPLSVHTALPRRGNSDGNHTARSSDDPNFYHNRLVRFYEKYNPEKVDRVDEFLAAYQGEEEQLFAILVGKYGAEPENPRSNATTSDHVPQAQADLFRSEGSMMHFVGPRYFSPRTVLPQDGNTDCETPFWPGNSRMISDRDILTLLKEMETENEELNKCYLGLLAGHPLESWNGMTYVSRCAVPDASEVFLGHVWAGTLANHKYMVHGGVTYRRTVLHCTEECQNLHLDPKVVKGMEAHIGKVHERWQLAIYRTELSNLLLIRSIWDPMISMEPLPDKDRSALTSSQSMPNSEDETRRAQRRQPPYGSRGRRSGSHMSAEQPTQPQQSPIIIALESMAQMLDNLDKRFSQQLNRIETRLVRMEEVMNLPPLDVNLSPEPGSLIGAQELPPK